MENIISADNLPEAEKFALEYIKENFANKTGSVKLPVEHNVEVLINHRGKIPMHSPEGWNFYFERSSTEEEWNLVHTEEY